MSFKKIENNTLTDQEIIDNIWSDYQKMLEEYFPTQVTKIYLREVEIIRNGVASTERIPDEILPKITYGLDFGYTNEQAW